MGVRGLVPFIQKTCPGIIKQIPERLRAFTGQTIVIDGTLITQRFHFANDPHPYRHVLGWYRLTHELHEAGVHAICIFDGKERSAAKLGEIQRRREVRRVDAARGLIERNRLARFNALTRLLASARTSSDVDAFARAKLYLRNLLSRDSHSAIPGTSSPVSPVYQGGELALDSDSVMANADSDISWGSIAADDLDDILLTPLPPSPVNAPSQVYDEQNWVHDDTYIASTQEHTVDEVESADLPVVQAFDSWIDVPYPPGEVQDFSAALGELYDEYRQSLSTLSVLPAVEAQDADGDDKAAAVAMSRAQAAIAHEEGAFWRTLAFSPLPLVFPPSPSPRTSTTSDLETPSPDPDPTSPTSQLGLILSKSADISASYLRRTHPPTETTYAQCIAILRAAGVPVITTRGATEAEALASALVRAGHGVAVASEDTDVLVHEAPLMRGLSSRDRPLTIIHGADLRVALELDRDAFVDFALLLGTDFAPRVHGVGPVRARKLVRAHGNIESALNQDKKFTTSLAPSTPDAYLRRIRAARGIFATDHVKLPPEDEMIQGVYDTEKVREVMMEYGLQRYLGAGEWEDGQDILKGNFFGDNPTVIGSKAPAWYGT